MRRYRPPGTTGQLAGRVSYRRGVGPVIRSMHATDAAAVDALAAAAYGPGFEDAAAFAAKVSAGVAVVAELDDEVVGYGVALPWSGDLPGLQARPAGRVATPEYLFVHDICVAAPARRTGLGPAIMVHFERTATDLGLTTMRCIAVHGADVVWARLGWVPSGHAAPDDYPPDSIPMERRAHAG